MTVLARANELELRLTKDAAEIAAAQRLRFRVFYDEMGAVPTPAMQAVGMDIDEFDAVADHLVVVDLARSTDHDPSVVGCYRSCASRSRSAAAASTPLGSST